MDKYIRRAGFPTPTFHALKALGQRSHAVCIIICTSYTKHMHDRRRQGAICPYGQIIRGHRCGHHAPRGNTHRRAVCVCGPVNYTQRVRGKDQNGRTPRRYAGQVGYITANMKTSSEARVGDTFFRVGAPVEPMPGFKEAKPMVCGLGLRLAVYGQCRLCIVSVYMACVYACVFYYVYACRWLERDEVDGMGLTLTAASPPGICRPIPC